MQVKHKRLEWVEGKVKGFFGKELMRLDNGTLKLIKIAPLSKTKAALFETSPQPVPRRVLTPTISPGQLWAFVTPNRPFFLPSGHGGTVTIAV